MKSVSKKKYQLQMMYHSKQQPSEFAMIKHKEESPIQDATRRFSETPVPLVMMGKKQSIDSRITYNKSEYPMNRNRSMTPVSRVTSSNVVKWQSHYKKLQQVLKKQNENFFHQNQFLKHQISKLYDRQAKHKQIIKKYKQQVRLLRMQNSVYQQRYQQIKSYINTVIQKITQMTITNQIIQDKDMLRSSSLQLVSKLREELNMYQQLKDDNQLKLSGKQTQSQQSIKQHQGFNDPEFQPNNVTNDFLQLSQEKTPDLNDLQQTRYLKQHKYYPNKTNGYSLKKPPKPIPPNYNKNNNNDKTYDKNNNTYDKNNSKNFDKDINTYGKSNNNNNNYDKKNSNIYDNRLSFSPVSYQQTNPSNENSNNKNFDMQIKTDNFLQDTSESNQFHIVNQQIQQLTDQSQALMYELKKKGNQDQQIKKKIIRISQKIRQLKMETQNQHFQRFTSLQQINPKY